MRFLKEPQKSNLTRMNHETLKATVDFFCSSNDEIEFVWHGGEPLFAGRDFFEDVVAFQEPWKQKGRQIANFLQTNGTLVDRAWAEFFRKAGFFVGVSLDAPRDVHDQLRLKKTGSGSFEESMRGISLLKDAGVFNGASCCIGKRNHLRVNEVLGFFLENGIKSIKFLRIRDSEESISEEQYGRFLSDVFHTWIDIDDPDFEIRDIKSAVNLLLGGDFHECTNMGRCEQFVTVYSDGSIFACDSFVNDPSMCFGNVFEPFEKVANGERFLQFCRTTHQKQAVCAGCEWFPMCNGGCLKDRYDISVGGKPRCCEANKQFFKEVREKLSCYNLESVPRR
jgi:uncharacterized protein